MPDRHFSAITPASLAQPNEESCFSNINAQDVLLERSALATRFSKLQKSQHVVIGATQFGAGLNFFAASKAFMQHAPDNATLHYIAAESHPLSRADLAQATKLWPAFGSLAGELIEQYPALTPGFHRQTLLSDRITLTLMFGDTLAMFAQLSARVDAWFISSFTLTKSPSSKAAMSKKLFERLAQLSHTGTTIAGNACDEAEQRELTQAGFNLGHPIPAEENQTSISGTWAGAEIPKESPIKKHQHLSGTSSRIAIVGAGLAGITSAAALTQRGYQVQLFDRSGAASGASGNLAGVVYTTPSAHPTPQNRFYQSSYLYALKKFRAMQFPSEKQDGALTGVLQLAKNERLAEKAYAALQSGLWPTELLGKPSTQDTKALSTNHSSENKHIAHDTNIQGALVLPQAGYISAPRWCARLLQQANLAISEKNVSHIARLNNGRWLLTFDDASTEPFDQVILANAAAALTLVSLPALKLKSIRGQVSYVKQTPSSEKWPYAICHAGYLTPAINGLHCVGATFDIEDREQEFRKEDDIKNIEQLKEYLPKQWQDLGGNDIEVHSRRVGFRCQSSDFLPLVGSLADIDEKMTGLWLNIAHGSRGITGTPLCAETLACMINDEPLPIDQDMAAALAPVRFTLRQAKRQGSRTRP